MAFNFTRRETPGPLTRPRTMPGVPKAIGRPVGGPIRNDRKDRAVGPQAPGSSSAPSSASVAQANRGVPEHLRGRENRDARREWGAQRHAAKKQARQVKHSLKAASRQLKGMNRSPMAGSKPGIGLAGGISKSANEPGVGVGVDQKIDANPSGTSITPSFGGGPLKDPRQSNQQY